MKSQTVAAQAPANQHLRNPNEKLYFYFALPAF